MEEKKCNCNEPYDAEFFQGGYPYCPVHDKRKEPPLTPERNLIYRIVEQWGNAIEMPNMEQWLKDYAATRQPGAGWVKASKFKTHVPVWRPYRKPCMEDEGEYDYGEIYVTEDDGRIYLDIDNECNYEHQSDERWKDYEILDEQPATAREEDAVEKGFIERIKDFNLSDVDAPVFTHTKEFEAHFSYIKGKLMDFINKQQKEK